MRTKTKRILTALLCAIMLIFTGCNNGDTSSLTSEPSTLEATDEGTGEETVSVPKKVAFVYNGFINDNGYTAEFERVRLLIETELELDTCYMEGVNVADFEQAVEVLSKSEATMIVSTSHKFTNIMKQTAKKYPGIDFMNYGTTAVGSNMGSYEGKIYQASYIAGTAAAFNSEAEKIGIVADPTLTLSRAVVNAFTLGSQFVYQNGDVRIAYGITAEEIHKAVNQLVEEGCDVIFGYTVSNEVADYCEKIGVTVIGNHNMGAADDSYEHLLMYFDYDWASFLLKQMRMYKREEWVPVSTNGGIFENIVAYSEVAPWAKEGTSDITATLREYVNNGKAQIFKGELQDNKGNIQVMRDKVMKDEQIELMEWLVKGITVSGNFIEPNTLVVPSDFVVKGD